MKTNMLEYTKMILSKVRFNRCIYWKEYRKHRRHLSPAEVSDLNAWLRSEQMLPIN